MIYLIICIITSSLLMVIFKVTGRRKLDSFQVIVVNYIIASLIGFSIGGFPTRDILNEPWLVNAIIIGILFIVIFLVMAFSTQISGIASTTVATKMSVIIPILFSIIYFDEKVTFLKCAGILLAMISVFLTVYKKDSIRSSKVSGLLLPLTLFIGAGIIDSLIKYTQELHIGENETMLFSSTLFTIAALSGLLYSPIRKISFRNYFKKEILLLGVALGIINFGSLYGIIMALESNIFDSSIIFGINNIGIVLLSVIFALALFSEKLSRTNRIGIFLSVIAIAILTLVG